MLFSLEELAYLAAVPESASHNYNDADKLSETHWIPCTKYYLSRTQCSNMGCVVWTHTHNGITYHRHGDAEYVFKFTYVGAIHVDSKESTEIESLLNMFHAA